jgi:Tol biopolymer transport system component
MNVTIALLAGCSPALQAASEPVEASLFVFRTDPPALVQLSAEQRLLREIPLAVPAGCALQGLYAAPVGPALAAEYSCSFGQAVALLDTDSGIIKQPVTDSDSHFMAWTPDGQAVYLKIDTSARPRIVLASLDGKQEQVPVTELTYDISPRPGRRDEFLFSFSRGMGLGSEMWLARSGGAVVKQVLADPRSYLSFARWSPDGGRIAFIKIPDSPTPFTVGELWVMNSDGSAARKLAEADAGHGFAEAWSPNGQRIAYVVRDNPNDADADQHAAALHSNLAVIGSNGGPETRLTHFDGARVDAPLWSPDGASITFTAVVDDKMNVYRTSVRSGQEPQVLARSACCPVWVPK